MKDHYTKLSKAIRNYRFHPFIQLMCVWCAAYSLFRARVTKKNEEENIKTKITSQHDCDDDDDDRDDEENNRRSNKTKMNILLCVHTFKPNRRKRKHTHTHTHPLTYG